MKKIINHAQEKPHHYGLAIIIIIVGFVLGFTFLKQEVRSDEYIISEEVIEAVENFEMELDSLLGALDAFDASRIIEESSNEEDDEESEEGEGDLQPEINNFSSNTQTMRQYITSIQNILHEMSSIESITVEACTMMKNEIDQTIAKIKDEVSIILATLEDDEYVLNIRIIFNQLSASWNQLEETLEEFRVSSSQEDIDQEDDNGVDYDDSNTVTFPQPTQDFDIYFKTQNTEESFAYINFKVIGEYSFLIENTRTEDVLYASLSSDDRRILINHSQINLIDGDVVRITFNAPDHETIIREFTYNEPVPQLRFSENVSIEISDNVTLGSQILVGNISLLNSNNETISIVNVSKKNEERQFNPLSSDENTPNRFQITSEFSDGTLLYVVNNENQIPSIGDEYKVDFQVDVMMNDTTQTLTGNIFVLFVPDTQPTNIDHTILGINNNEYSVRITWDFDGNLSTPHNGFEVRLRDVAITEGNSFETRLTPGMHSVIISPLYTYPLYSNKATLAQYSFTLDQFENPGEGDNGENVNNSLCKEGSEIELKLGSNEYSVMDGKDSVAVNLIGLQDENLQLLNAERNIFVQKDGELILYSENGNGIRFINISSLGTPKICEKIIEDSGGEQDIPTGSTFRIHDQDALRARKVMHEITQFHNTISARGYLTAEIQEAYDIFISNFEKSLLRYSLGDTNDIMRSFNSLEAYGEALFMSIPEEVITNENDPLTESIIRISDNVDVLSSCFEPRNVSDERTPVQSLVFTDGSRQRNIYASQDFRVLGINERRIELGSNDEGMKFADFIQFDPRRNTSGLSLESAFCEVEILNESAPDTRVYISDSTFISSSDEWDGVFLPPQIITNENRGTIPGYEFKGDIVAIGSNTATLEFDKPVRVFMDGAEAPIAYRKNNESSWQIIDTICPEGAFLGNDILCYIQEENGVHIVSSTLSQFTQIQDASRTSPNDTSSQRRSSATLLREDTVNELMSEMTITHEINSAQDAWNNLIPLGRNDKILTRGSRGESVTRLQALLNLYQESQLQVDGIFGPHTEREVRIFQSLTGLVSDGKVGPLTELMLIIVTILR